jgi:hypothetical protein
MSKRALAVAAVLVAALAHWCSDMPPQAPGHTATPTETRP